MEKEQRKNALGDELHALENEIAQKRKDFEKELNEHRAELEAREDAVTKREKDMAALQEEVETFPRRLENKLQAVVKETTEQLTNDFEKNRTPEARWMSPGSPFVTRQDLQDKQDFFSPRR